MFNLNFDTFIIEPSVLLKNVSIELSSH